MADLATLRSQLAEAQAARHLALTKGQITDVWNNGRRIKYSATDLNDLTAYINELQGQIIALDPTGPEAQATGFRRSAIGVRF